MAAQWTCRDCQNEDPTVERAPCLLQVEMIARPEYCPMSGLLCDWWETHSEGGS